MSRVFRLAEVGRRASKMPLREAHFFHFCERGQPRVSRQPLLGQPDEKHRRGYEYCVIARFPRNKREPVTMTPFLSLPLPPSFSLFVSLSGMAPAFLDGHRRPTGTMNFKFSAAMQTRKPRANGARMKPGAAEIYPAKLRREITVPTF